MKDKEILLVEIKNDVREIKNLLRDEYDERLMLYLEKIKENLSKGKIKKAYALTKEAKKYSMKRRNIKNPNQNTAMQNKQRSDKGIKRKNTKKLVFKSNNKSRPISILGSGGVGKTVFFATLSYVFKNQMYTDMVMEYDRGLGYLMEVRKYLEKGEWPPKTLKGERYYFSANIHEKTRWGTKIHRINLTDIAGEDFDEFTDPKKPVSKIPKKYKHLLNAGAYIFLVDPGKAKEDMWKFYRFVQFLVKYKGLGVKRKMDEKIAVVFTKADKYENVMKNPERYLKEEMGDLWDLLHLRAKRWKVFAVSAVGHTTPDGKPRTPITPIGMGNLMDWLLRGRE